MIKKIYNRILKKNKSSYKSYLKKLQELNLINYDESSIVKGLLLENRGTINKECLRIGKESVVSGNYYIENNNGYIKIGDRTFIGGGKFISINKIEIGDDVLISWGCTFMDNNAHSLSWSERKNDVRDWKKGLDENKVGKYKDWSNVKSAPIVIKDKAWIGFDVIVLKGVTIGEGAVVGSRSVVTKNVPDWTIVAGNPAQIIKQIPEEER